MPRNPVTLCHNLRSKVLNTFLCILVDGFYNVVGLIAPRLRHEHDSSRSVGLEISGMGGDKIMEIGECVLRSSYMCDSIFHIPHKLYHHCIAPAALRNISRFGLDFANPQRSLSKKVAFPDCLCSVSAVKVGNTLSVLSNNLSHNENSE
jgi:hypothetical protein